MAVDLSGKRLELLKQAVPTLSRVALLTDPKTDPFREHTIKANQAAASALGITLWPIDVASPEDVEPVFARIVRTALMASCLGPDRQYSIGGRVLVLRPSGISYRQ